MLTKQFFSGDMLYDLYNIAITPQTKNYKYLESYSDKSFLDEFGTLNIRLPRQTGHTTASINFVNRIFPTGNYDIYYICHSLDSRNYTKNIGYTFSGEKIRDAINLDVDMYSNHKQFSDYNFPCNSDYFEKNVIIITDLYFMLSKKKKTLKLYEQQLLFILKECRQKQLTFMSINLQ